MITAQVETLAGGGLDELKPLLPIHWEELALNKDKVPLDPQYDVYLAREAKGEVLFVSLRETGKLIGYFVGFIAPGLHYRTCLTLTMDIFFVEPSRRGHRGGVILFREVLREAKRRGVQRAFFGSKLHKDAGRLFQAFGFEAVETYYSAWLGD